MSIKRPGGRSGYIKDYGNGSRSLSGTRSGHGGGRAPSPPDADAIETFRADDVPIEKLRQYHREIGDLLERYDTPKSGFDRLSRHVRRHLPLYAMAAIFALVVVLVPTTNGTGGPGAITGDGTGLTTDDQAYGDGTGADSSDTGDVSLGGGGGGTGSGSTANTPGGQVASRVGNLAGRGGSGPVAVPGAPPPSGSKSIGPVKVGTGTTRGGFACKPGIRQIQFSAYAFPCLAKFTGANGGKTYRGVDEKTITFVVRKTADSGGPSAQTVDAANKAAGSATRTEALQFAKQYWIPWFNRVMELYGRQVKLVEYGSTQSNGVDEAQSKGKTGACADATAIANSIKGFAVIGFTTGFGESQPFAQCAKEKGGLMVPIAGAYFPEGKVTDPKGVNVNGLSYRSWQPYAYHIAMQCEQIAQDVAEYIGKRLANRPPKWARDAKYLNKALTPKRVFGTYVPDNDGYQHCVNISEGDLKTKYNVIIKSRYDYPLDVSRFPDSAAQGVLQFQRAGVTTLLNACDTISTRLMTEAADKSQWGPEWLIIGVAGQDTDGQARNFNKSAVQGHLFGLSQLGPDEKILGKNGEAYKAFKAANPNVEPPQGALQLYYPLLHIFNLLQASGPTLTPQNIAVGVSKMPAGGGAKGAVGTWSLSGDHTEIDDSREVYWDGAKKGFDRKDGTYVETYGGARFSSGEWPKEEPKIPVK